MASHFTLFSQSPSLNLYKYLSFPVFILSLSIALYYYLSSIIYIYYATSTSVLVNLGTFSSIFSSCLYILLHDISLYSMYPHYRIFVIKCSLYYPALGIVSSHTSIILCALYLFFWPAVVPDRCKRRPKYTWKSASLFLDNSASH